MEWQPIETAPKDGTQILAYRLSQYGSHYYAVCEWDRVDGEWMYAGEFSITPTHWMPLPDPPIQ